MLTVSVLTNVTNISIFSISVSSWYEREALGIVQSDAELIAVFECLILARSVGWALLFLLFNCLVYLRQLVRFGFVFGGTQL